MRIKAIRNYYDLQLEKNIQIDDTYEVTEERGKQIINVGYAIEIPEEKKEEKKEEKNIKKESKSKKK